jgi:hypothetical protein
MQKYGIANRKLENTFLFCGRPGSLAQDKETAGYVATKVIEVYQILDRNINIIKTQIAIY